MHFRDALFLLPQRYKRKIEVRKHQGGRKKIFSITLQDCMQSEAGLWGQMADTLCKRLALPCDSCHSAFLSVSVSCVIPLRSGDESGLAVAASPFASSVPCFPFLHRVPAGEHGGPSRRRMSAPSLSRRHLRTRPRHR